MPLKCTRSQTLAAGLKGAGRGNAHTHGELTENEHRAACEMADRNRQREQAAGIDAQRTRQVDAGPQQSQQRRVVAGAHQNDRRPLHTAVCPFNRSMNTGTLCAGNSTQPALPGSLPAGPYTAEPFPAGAVLTVGV